MIITKIFGTNLSLYTKLSLCLRRKPNHFKDLKDMNFDLPFDLLGIPGFSFDPPPMADGSQELSEGDFQNFDHKCPKCNFEWDDNE